MGRGDFGELLAKLEEQYGTETNSAETSIKKYDVIVAGGGPAGSAAAIYSARKGLNVAVIAERIGGQVKETVGIENLISVPSTTGSQLADNLKTHMSQYPIDLLEHRQIEKIELDGKDKVLTAKGGERFSAPAVIVATGASWRKLNVPGEAEYIGRGVAFCPHCDGPFYKGKQVAVVGRKFRNRSSHRPGRYLLQSYGARVYGRAESGSGFTGKTEKPAECRSSCSFADNRSGRQWR